MACSLSTFWRQRNGALLLLAAASLPALPARAADDPKHPPQAQMAVPADRSAGNPAVIQPPAVADPGIKVPTPNPQAFPTPVIPPPGSPGGNPQVVPK